MIQEGKIPAGSVVGVVAQCLKEQHWYWLWLDTKKPTGVQVAEPILLEQFIQVLLAGGRGWVKRHRPATLAEAVTLMENYVAAEGPASLILRTKTPELRTPTHSGGWAGMESPGLLNWMLHFRLLLSTGPDPRHQGGAARGPRSLGRGVNAPWKTPQPQRRASQPQLQRVTVLSADRKDIFR